MALGANPFKDRADARYPCGAREIVRILAMICRFYLLACLTLRATFSNAARTSHLSSDKIAGVNDEDRWAVKPNPTADDYASVGLPFPEVAPARIETKPDISTIVKLECIDGPYVIRPLYQYDQLETEHPRSSSLLLNSTLSENRRDLLLNDEAIYPDVHTQGWTEYSIKAYQTLANVTQRELGLMIEYSMLHESFTMGTKYGQVSLSYTRKIKMAAARELKEHFEAIDLSFDVIGVSYQVGNAGEYNKIINDPSQQMAHIVMHRYRNSTLRLVSAESNSRSLKELESGWDSDTDVFTFKAWEWDYYGRKGTWKRAAYLCTETLFGSLPQVIIVSIVLALFGYKGWKSRLRNQRQRKAYEVEKLRI